jgi:hypothetical protein
MNNSPLNRPYWGDNIILFITTHGIIVKEDENADFNTFTVPQGITIKRTLASVPGECNFMDDETVEEYVSLVNRFMSELTSNRETTQNYAIEKISNAMHKSDKNKIKISLNETYDDDDFDEVDYNNYVNQFDKSFNYKQFLPGEEMINKQFKRTNELVKKHDWSINIMNMPGHPDLLSFLKIQTRRGDSIITLKEIVDFLKNKGVTQIILFDMSCSSIMNNEYNEYNQRVIRKSRRNIIDRKIGGKKSKYKRKVKKINNKNRRRTNKNRRKC